MKKIILAILILLVLLPILTYGETVTTPQNTEVSGQADPINPNLPNIPGTKDVSDVNTGGPAALVYNIYIIALWLGGALAFASILFAGIQYLSARGSTEAVSSAKGRLQNAILGLLLLLGMYILLGIINPDLTQLRLPVLQKLPDPPVSGGYACLDQASGSKVESCHKDNTCDSKCDGTRCVRMDSCGTGGTGAYGFEGMTVPPGTLSNSAARSQLATGAGITINKNDCRLPPGAASCTASYTSCTNCTSLDGLPQRAVDGLLKIAAGCNCSFQVTGGTEAGHKEHGVGQAIVDLEPSNAKLNDYIYATTGINASLRKAFQTIAGNDGIRYMWEDNPPHWHVRF